MSKVYVANSTFSARIWSNNELKKRREEFKVEGYGMSLESCFKVIINYRIAKKVETTSLKEYIRMYSEESQKLTEELSKLKVVPDVIC